MLRASAGVAGRFPYAQMAFAARSTRLTFVARIFSPFSFFPMIRLSSSPTRTPVHPSAREANRIGMEIISQIRKQFPQLSIHVHQDTLTNVMASVIAQERDLGIVALPLRSLRELSPKLRIHPFRSERLAAACAAGHPLASQEYVTIQQLCSYPLVLHDDKIIMDILGDLFRAHQENLALTYSNNNTLIRQMVYKGEAVSIYTTALEKTDPLVCSGGIKLIPLKDSSLADDLFQISFSCLSYPKRQLNPCERQFIRLLQSVDEAGEKIFVSSF